MIFKTYFKNFIIKIKRFLHESQGSTIEYDLCEYEGIVQTILEQQLEFKKCSEESLQQQSKRLKERSQSGQFGKVDLITSFALIAEAMERKLNMTPYPVQLIGALAMHAGKCIEMQTGEGKTLVAVFTAYVQSLKGQGVHVLTFNDYLAKRDADWMGPVYHFLGLTVGIIQEGMSQTERQQAYQCDVTYLTAKEAGFDFLRDSLVLENDQKVHRGLHYAIIDEADSILIDEARVPLVIAGISDEVASTHFKLDQLVRKLKPDRDFSCDVQANSIHLTDIGLKRVEQLLDCHNLYDSKNLELLTQLNCALQAEYLLEIDRDYIVRHGKIEIVDEFTGRLADKRRWPDGLHAAVEAKENIVIQAKGRQLNTITLQHFLQMYKTKCGMTATAQSAAEELQRFFNLHITVVPPNQPSCRVDFDDEIFVSKEDKEGALLQEIISVHQKGRPILIGTASVGESEHLAELLDQHGILFNVLNAKQDELEAQIIAEAGQPAAVTISTNMAGRGTDIKLGGSDEKQKKRVIACGGLYVIGTSRYESRRIDNQLRGRAGRQGDPGSSRFFLSLEDDLFVKYNLSSVLPRVMDKKDILKSLLIKKEMEHIQRRIEAQFLALKTILCNYSDLIEQQRVILFEERKLFLDDETCCSFYKTKAAKHYSYLGSNTTEDQIRKTCRIIGLRCIDQSWADYLAEIADVRESIHLSKIGGDDASIAFHKIAINLFETYQEEVIQRIITIFEQVTIRDNKLMIKNIGTAPAATWTYLIHDNPFETMLGMQLTQDMGHAVYAGLMWPLLLLYPLLRRKKK